MLEKSRKVNGPKFHRFKKNTAQTSSNNINFAPRPHTEKRSAHTENLSLPKSSSSSSNKRLKLTEKRDSMLEKSFLINGPRYPRYNKTKQQPQQQQQEQQQQSNNNVNKKEKQIAIKRKVSMKSPFLRSIQLLKSQKQLDMLYGLNISHSSVHGFLGRRSRIKSPRKCLKWLNVAYKIDHSLSYMASGKVPFPSQLTCPFG